MLKSCIKCSKNFYSRPVNIRSGRAKYCSRKCKTDSAKGKPTWNKGKKFAYKPHPWKIGQIPKSAFKKGEIPKGSILFKKGQVAPMKGKVNLKIRGINNHNWKGGITPINKKIRESLEYEEWRTKVFERDLYTCQSCGEIGGYLQADHIKRFAEYPDLRLNIDNGQTLCIKCHRIKTSEEMIIINQKRRI